MKKLNEIIPMLLVKQERSIQPIPVMDSAEILKSVNHLDISGSMMMTMFYVHS